MVVYSMNKFDKNIIKQYKSNYKGQTIIVSVFKPKEKQKGVNNARSVFSNCPNCNSKLVINVMGAWECTSDKLNYWVLEFKKFMQMLPDKQIEYIKQLTSDSNFFDLYDKWLTAYNDNKPENFNCGYTNNTSLPIGNNKTIIPDPMFCKFLELGLKRSLTERELRNEATLWIRREKIKDKWFLGARAVVIPYIILPDEEEI